MRASLSLLVMACGIAGQAQALDLTLGSVVQTTFVTSKVTSAPFDDKRLRAARDDAASFVASAGAIRGARLEAALRSLRADYPAARNASDLALAEAILGR